MRLELGTLKSRLITDNPEILKELYRKYSFTVPGYQYATAYKQRRWDGKKNHVTAKGVFKTGLLTRILKDLESIGVNLKEHLNYEEPKQEIKRVNVKKFKYRDYQEEAIDYCLKHKRAIVDSPTGSGKTLIMAGIIAALQADNPDVTVTVFFGKKQLQQQTYKFFQQCGIKNLGYNSGEGYEHGNIMCTTVQSIDRIIDTHLDQSECMMVDEAHEFCVGDSRIAVIESFPNATFRFGFTATPQSESPKTVNARMVLEGAFGAVYNTRSAEDLIKDGSLAKPIIQIIEQEPEKSPDPDISYLDAYEEYIVENEARNKKIGKLVESIYKSKPKSKVLILVKNLQHVENLKEVVPNYYTIEGKDDIETRYEVINKFVASEEACTIIGTNVLQTGISIDEITHMVNARGLEGEIPTIQGLGRGTRKAEGKDTMYFYDFYDKVPYLEKHSKARIKHYTKLNFEVNHVKF